jgi:PEP-CTERM motif
MKFKRSHLVVSWLALSAILVFSGTAHASVLTPGPGAFPPDIFTMAGATFEGNIITGPVTSGALILTVDAGVYSDPTNTFCAGCLDFVYQVSNSANSTDSVGRVSAVNFTGFQTDVGFLPTGSSLGNGFVDGSVSPELVDRVNPSVVGFSFNAPLTLLIPPGSTSVVLVVQTDATNFTTGNVNIIDGSTFTEPALAPSSTPEPSSFLLFGTGLLSLGCAIRRKLGS